MKISAEQIQSIIVEELEKTLEEQFDLSSALDAKKMIDFYRMGSLSKREREPEEQLQSPLSDKQKMTMALKAIRNLQSLKEKDPKKWEKAAGMDQIERALKKRIKDYQPSDGVDIARYIADYYGSPDSLALLISKKGKK